MMIVIDGKDNISKECFQKRINPKTKPGKGKIIEGGTTKLVENVWMGGK